jgi:hypothetical protein
MSTKNCNTSTLSKCTTILSSGCVKYTGDGILDTEASILIEELECNSSIDQVIAVFDKEIFNIKTNLYISQTQLVTDSDCNNDLVSDFQIIRDLITGAVKPEPNKLYTSDVVLALVKIVCDLQSQIDEINVCDAHQCDISEDLRLFLQTTGDCLVDTTCGTSLTTYDDLLKRIITKLCNCCN